MTVTESDRVELVPAVDELTAEAAVLQARLEEWGRRYQAVEQHIDEAWDASWPKNIDLPNTSDFIPQLRDLALFGAWFTNFDSLESTLDEEATDNG